jgi:hypothetical protein
MLCQLIVFTSRRSAKAMGLECSADPSGPPVAWTHFSREFRVRVRIERILANAPSKTRHISKFPVGPGSPLISLDFGPDAPEPERPLCQKF